MEFTRVCAEINLENIRKNVISMMNRQDSKTGALGVVKADAYGHGAVPVARALSDLVSGFAVATYEEALELKENGIENWILILAPVHPSLYEEIINLQIRVPVFTLEQGKALSETAERLGKKAYVHLAVDTGMTRIGMWPNEEGQSLAQEICSLPGICVEGMFTHLATADMIQNQPALQQMEKFIEFSEAVQEKTGPIPYVHYANTATTMVLDTQHTDLCRLGIGIYGLLPSEEIDIQETPILPAMSLYSKVLFVKDVKKGTAVSYGGTFVAEKDMRIATVSVGYADGYPRSLSNKGEVLIHGKRARILGRVCMDQLMVDVSSVEDVKEWDLVTLIGQDGEERITMEELSEKSGRFNYEFACDISKRVPRIYTESGKEA